MLHPVPVQQPNIMSAKDCQRDPVFQIPILKTVIASETKQSRPFNEISSHLSGGRGDGKEKRFQSHNRNGGVFSVMNNERPPGSWVTLIPYGPSF